MTLLQKLFGRKQTHEEWLAAHPGKESTKAPPMTIDEDERQRMRVQREGELDQQRDARQDKA